MNSYGIKASGFHFNNKYFDISSLDNDINHYLSEISTFEKIKISINFVSDQITFQYNFMKYTKNNFGSHSIKQIRIKCENIDNASVEENNLKTTDISNNDLFLNEQFCVVLLHEKFAVATKIEKYWMIINGKRLPKCFFPSKISLHNESYFVYFVRNGEEIRGDIITGNNVSSDNNNIIQVQCNLVSPYPSNENFCKILATFNTLKQNKNFMYYYPKNISFFKILDS